MNKTREEAEKVINTILSTHNLECRKQKHIVVEILDALYPKPESERLKQLRKALAFYRWKQGQTADPERIDLVLELIDEAIKAEKAKS